jgi:acetylornithine/N-succinyldiaminopimelate aminotransferase
MSLLTEKISIKHILSRSFITARISYLFKKSQFVFEFFKDKKGVVSVDGLGLMIGIKIEKEVKTVIAECIERGVLCLSAKDKLRLLPPLNIPMNVLEKALNVIAEVLAN